MIELFPVNTSESQHFIFLLVQCLDCCIDSIKTMYRQVGLRKIYSSKKPFSMLNFFLSVFFVAALILIAIFLVPHPSETYLLLQLSLQRQLVNLCKNETNQIAGDQKESEVLLPEHQTLPKDFTKISSSQETIIAEENAQHVYAQSEFMRNISLVINPHDFNYSILVDHPCRGYRSDIFMLIYVHTDPRHFKQRMFIRETWGSIRLYDRLKTVVVFMMGVVADGFEKIRTEAQVRLESDRFKDIVQEDFVDSYRNLTYKALMGLKWTAKSLVWGTGFDQHHINEVICGNTPVCVTYCPQAKYVLKIDDDVFVNIFNFVRHVSAMYQRQIAAENTIACYIWDNVKVQRNKKDKWYVSKEEYPADHYSKYCSGAAFLLSSDLVGKLFNESLYTRFFWVDDFFVTGQLAKQVGAEYRNFNSLYSFADVTVQQEQLTGEYYVFGHLPGATLTQRYALWRTISETHTDGDRIF